jgi:hypothetical protein
MPYTPGMDATLALRALAAIIADAAMRDRFIDLTGYDAGTLRARAGHADVHEAVAAFLAGHEPDLIAVARTLGVKPEMIVA